MLAVEGAESDLHPRLQAGDDAPRRVREGEDRVVAAMGDEDALGGVVAAGGEGHAGGVG